MTAVISNTYTGDGTTDLFALSFPYIEANDVNVTVNNVALTVTTEWVFSTGSQIQILTPPASGASVYIYRGTSDDFLKASFSPGSAIRARDLNDNFNQALYVVQEATATSAATTATANTAKTTADTALTNSAAAVATANTTIAAANTANTNSAAAVVTANASNATSATAASDAASAVATAGTALTNSAASVVTANAADANATTALNNSRESDGSGGFTTAIAKATTALSTATTSSTDSSAAVVTANAASSSAATALSTANAASAAVSSAVLFTLIANVAAIPGSPSNNDYVEMGNSTGVESFSPLSGVPSGFVGATGLTVRLRYDSSASSWVWMSYFANDSETRYLTKNIPVVTGDSTNGSGQITLNCENNSHGIKIKGPPHSAAANYTLTLPNTTGTSGQALTTNGSGVLSFATVDSAFIETPQAITVNKVIAASTNAGMMGPTVSINSGITITVGANSQLTVLN